MASLEELEPLIAGERKYISTWHCVKDTFRQEGFIGMYRGMGITMIRAFIGISPPSLLFPEETYFSKLMQLPFMDMNG